MSWLKARDWSSGVEYSSLLNSGLRAITGRRLPFPTTTTASSRRNSTAIVSTPPSEDDDDDSGNTHAHARHNRRASIMSFSSRLLTRTRSTTNRGESTAGSPSPAGNAKGRKGPGEKTVKPRPSSMFVHASYQIPDLWPTRKGRFSSLNPAADAYAFVEEEYDDSIDPFSSAPNAKSYILDIRPADPSPPSPPPSSSPPPVLSSSPILSHEDRASFLSLAPPTPDTTSPAPTPQHRARPMSAQTMPAPARPMPPSRRSSTHHGTNVYLPDPPPYSSRDDRAWVLSEPGHDRVPTYHRDAADDDGDEEEADAEIDMLDLSDDEEEYDDYDGVHECVRHQVVGLGGAEAEAEAPPPEWLQGGPGEDWRQFHIDFLQDVRAL